MTNPLFLFDCWHVAAWSAEVKSDAPFGRQLLGRPVVLWRNEQGQCSAFEDICPHRFAPLSMGRLEGGKLRCMYHGLLFEGSGRCVEVPGQDGDFKALAATTFPVVERQSLIWIWMGNPELADTSLIPDCRWLEDPAWQWEPGYFHYDANYQLIVDNLLDFSHLSFVHEKTLGGTPTTANNPPQIEREAWGARVTHWHLNEPVPPAYQPFVGFQGLSDRWMIYDWYIQGNVLSMEAGFSPAGTGAPSGVRTPGTIINHPVQAVTPEGPDSAHYFWSSPRNYALGDEAVSKLQKQQIEAAFLEDKLMIEAQAKNIARAGERTMRGIRADVALWHVRNLMSKKGAASGPAANAS